MSQWNGQHIWVWGSFKDAGRRELCDPTKTVIKLFKMSLTHQQERGLFKVEISCINNNMSAGAAGFEGE